MGENRQPIEAFGILFSVEIKFIVNSLPPPVGAVSNRTGFGTVIEMLFDFFQYIPGRCGFSTAPVPTRRAFSRYIGILPDRIGTPTS